MYTDPIAQVLITNELEDKRWDFSPVGKSQFVDDAIHLPFLTAVTIFYEMQRLGSITITIDAPYEEGIKQFLTPPSPFAIGNMVQARIGYASGLFTEWAIGHLTQGGTGIAVDASGVTGSVVFAQAARPAFYSVPKDAPGTGTLADYLKFIAEYMGLTLFLGPKAQEQVDKERLDDEYGLHTFGDMTMPVFDMLKKICDDEDLRWLIGPSPYKEPGDITRYLNIITDAEFFDLKTSLTRRKYVMRGVLDPSIDQFPLLSWSPEGEGFATWLAETPDPAAGGTMTTYVDMFTGQTKFFDTPPEGAEGKIVGVLAEQAPAAIEFSGNVLDRIRDQEAAAELFSQPVKEGEDGKAQAERKARKKQVDGNAAQLGTISTIGIPEEKPENFCDVVGLGSVYDGVYKIRKISHIYAAGSYDTSLTVFRFGTGGQEKIDGEQVETQGGQAT